MKDFFKKKAQPEANTSRSPEQGSSLDHGAPSTSPTLAALVRGDRKVVRDRGAAVDTQQPQNGPTSPARLLDTKDTRSTYTFHSFSLRIKDPERSLRFFVDGLGMDIVKHTEADDHSMYFVGYRTPGTEGRDDVTFGRRLGLIQLVHVHGDENDPNFAIRHGTGYNHMTISVPDVEKSRQRLETLGVRVVEDGSNTRGFAVVEDPDGYHVQLMSQDEGQDDALREQLEQLMSQPASNFVFHTNQKSPTASGRPIGSPPNARTSSAQTLSDEATLQEQRLLQSLQNARGGSPSTVVMEALLAAEIKSFRKQFRRENGRDPSRKDMAKQPGISATYDAWLAYKSTAAESGHRPPLKQDRRQTSRSESSVGGSTSHNRRNKPKLDQDANSDRDHRQNLKQNKEDKNEQQVRDDRKELGYQSTTTQVPAPPSTPRRDKKTVDVFKTPTQRPHRNDLDANIHSSGGSIVDVPLTPQRSTMKHKNQKGVRPHHPQHETSPAKIASKKGFDDGTSPTKLHALIASFAATREQLTPSKMEGLHSYVDSDDDDTELRRQLRTSMHTQQHTFTPRTKARKRLRGEIIVTPSKGVNVEQGGTPSKVRTDAQPLRKKRRGMGTLADFGIIPVTGPRNKQNMAFASQKSMEAEALEESDDDEVIGPSPSANKIADISLRAFQPLFGTACDSDEEADDTDMEEGGSASFEEPSLDTTPTSDDDLRDVRAYSMYRSKPGKSVVSLEDSDDETPDIWSGRKSHVDELPISSNDSPKTSYHEEQQQTLFHNLSLESPQRKKVLRHQKRRQADDLRTLLEADFQYDASDLSDDKGARQGVSAKHGRNAQQTKNIVKGKQGSTDMQVDQRTSLFLKRGRDEVDELDQEEPSIGEGDDIDTRSVLDESADEDWASDVGSEDYGVGDGMMDDYDVA